MSRTNTKGIVKVHPMNLRNFLAGPRTAVKKPHTAGPAPIAPGFHANHAYDLKQHKGKTIAHLAYRNIYLGSEKWASSDIQKIDTALEGAMSDSKLNHVIQQYFDPAPMSTKFLGTNSDDSPIQGVYDRDSVSATLDRLYAAGQLAIDFPNTLVNLLLPPGVVLDTTGTGEVRAGGDEDDDNKDSSREGLGGYHGSHKTQDGKTIYFAVAVYSQQTADGANGIPVWSEPWKNVVATLYHELNEARTDADVEQVNATGKSKLLGWYSDEGGEIGDIPVTLAGDNLHSVFVEETLQNGKTAPIQLMWSNAAGGPGLPF